MTLEDIVASHAGACPGPAAAVSCPDSCAIVGQADRSGWVVLGGDACLRWEPRVRPGAARVRPALGDDRSVVENRFTAASRQHKDGRDDDDFL